MMDKRIRLLGKDQRIALARVVSDIIIADKIIDDDEILKFESLFGNDNNREVFLQAQRISFAQALNILVLPERRDDGSRITDNLNWKARKEIVGIVESVVRETVLCDGICAPSEAIILYAIDRFLQKNNDSYSKYSVQSFPLTDLFIGKRFLLYVDTNNSSQSCIIESNYHLIVNLLAGIGYQFIYIPQIVEQYETRGLEMFKKMSMYIFPDIPEEKVTEVYKSIIDMTTAIFTKKYLKEKMGFDIVCPRPALMIMLGRSSVLGNDLSDKGLAYKTYANFLKINIGNENILDIISDLVKDFNSLVSYNLNIDFNPSKNKLLYHGFHKAFFRMVALAKENYNKYSVNIDTSLGAVFINDRKLPLEVGKTAIYVLILCRCFGGDRKGLPMNIEYDSLDAHEKDVLQKQYETICGCLKNCNNPLTRKPLYPSVKHRISEIKNAINDIVDSRFIGEIQIGTGNYVQTLIKPTSVTINTIPILQHPLWDRLF